MAGKKGQIQRNLCKKAGRQKVWQSMRILKKFTLPDLIRTSGEDEGNVRKVVLNLATHGYLAEAPGWVRGRPGGHKYWLLRLNPGPARPAVCVTCGLPITARQCGGEIEGEAA